MATYTIDPDGDVILQLEYPNDPFASECGTSHTDTQSLKSTALTGIDSFLNTIYPPQDITEPGEGNETELVTFLVSSRHLTLASPVFKSALTGGWKESVKTEGKHQIKTQGWDTTALGIFLNAIHCQYRQVPRLLELEMLAKVAVIVDYYAAHQAIEILSPIWIDALRPSLPTTTCHDRTIALWICISWVFSDSSAFETATKVAIHHGHSTMSDFGLPIPGRVIANINDNRMLQVAKIFVELTDLQKDLLDTSRKGCSIECRTMQLGALTRLLNSTSLLKYSLGNDFSVGEVLKVVEAAVCPTWYDRHYSQPHRCPSPGNAFDNTRKSIASNIKGDTKGLKIRDYVKSTIKE